MRLLSDRSIHGPSTYDSQALVGLMAHIIEEQQNPIGQKVWDMASGA